MGRRKKEPPSAHREKIADAAQSLFTRKGIGAATMEDIAKEAGYSKATLYVYFTDKEELVGFLVLKSMRMLHSLIAEALAQPVSVKEKYLGICRALAEYRERYPLYFTLALGEIHVDFEGRDWLPEEKETFEIGEQINDVLLQFLRAGTESGELLPDAAALPTVFLFWSSLSGLIQMAAKKQEYIGKAMNLSREQFLEFGFERLFRLIAGKEST